MWTMQVLSMVFVALSMVGGVETAYDRIKASDFKAADILWLQAELVCQAIVVFTLFNLEVAP